MCKVGIFALCRHYFGVALLSLILHPGRMSATHKYGLLGVYKCTLLVNLYLHTATGGYREVALHLDHAISIIHRTRRSTMNIVSCRAKFSPPRYMQYSRTRAMCTDMNEVCSFLYRGAYIVVSPSFGGNTKGVV